MSRLLRILLPLTLLAAAAPDIRATFEALRAQDARLASVAWRLTTANAALCRDQQPGTGLVLHAIDQYAARDADTARAVFGFAEPVAVEWVVPGSPAARAGIVQNEGLAAIAGAPLTAPTAAHDTSATRDAALARLAARPLGAPIVLTLNDSHGTRRAVIAPVPACRSEFEVVAGPKLGASSDGHVVQVGARLMETYGDDDVAVVVAHELAHTILRHRARLEAAGVKWGLFGEFGRNARLFRKTETEADVLGAFLLRNAGWDPQNAVRFWQGPGKKVDPGMFRSRTHPSPKERAAVIAEALAAVPAGAPTPYLPPILDQRDAALR
ncbi:M48 family metallopeptidase [uncultured Sphingomonas sp.]|uniref:M48 family metallopeptidase n=1 Tax=uncultured Sphingomonas sp. TaxID=158754 RepID=UPI00262E8827|nr:M48 family metallopeptidase [uncultured Sphingomonas sp.]